jgi:hypothetical protein
MGRVISLGSDFLGRADESPAGGEQRRDQQGGCARPWRKRIRMQGKRDRKARKYVCKALKLI